MQKIIIPVKISYHIISIVLGAGLFVAALDLYGLENISRARFEEKIEFYKVSYPAFNYQEAREEALAKFQTLKPGVEVSIFDGTKNVKGTFRGLRDGWVLIDGDSVALHNVVPADRYLYSQDEAEIAKKKYLEEKFHQYSRKRGEDIVEYRRSLERTCHIIEDGTPDKGDPNTGTVADKKIEKKSIPALGIVRNDISMGKTTLPAGSVVRNLHKNEFDRYSFTAPDGRTSVTPAANITVIEDVYDIRDAFLLSQIALGQLARNQVDEAVFYTKLAALADPLMKRNEIIMAAILAVNNTADIVRQNNIAITLLDQEIVQLTRQIATNQAALHDEFAVKGGTRDRSTVLGQQVLVAREKRKALQCTTKETLSNLLREIKNLTEQAGADGDFITACILMDWLEQRFIPLAGQAKVWWDDEEKQRLVTFFDQQHLAIAADYAKQIADSEEDRWFRSLDHFVALYGEENSLTEKLNVKPLYPRMLSAAKATLKEAYVYSTAIYNEDWPVVLATGIKMTVLIMHSDAAESCRKQMETAILRIEAKRRQLLELFNQKKYQEFLTGCKTYPTAQPEWLANIAKAEQAIRDSGTALRQALTAAEKKDFEQTQTALQRARELWPGNQAAEQFYKEFRVANRELLQDITMVQLHLNNGRYRDAMEKCDLMFKEYPQYQRYVVQLRAQIRQAAAAPANAK